MIGPSVIPEPGAFYASRVIHASANTRTHFASWKAITSGDPKFAILHRARMWNGCLDTVFRLQIRCKRKKTSFRNTRHVQHTAKDAVGMIMRSLGVQGASVAATLEFQSRWLQLADWFDLFEEIGKENRWLLAIEVFRWMQQQKWYKPDDGFYAKLISIVGKKGQLRLAMWLFAEMRRNGCRPDTSVYNSLIAAHVRSKDKEQALLKAFGYLEKMKQKVRCQPNIVTYNILLRACAQAHLFDKVDELFEEMQAAKIQPDIYTFNGILDAYGKSSHFLEMELALKKMIELKCKPDVITFNILIDAYGKGRLLVKMEQAFKSMTRAKAKPTLPTFNSLICNYGRAGLVEKMECMFEEMAEADIQASFVTYELLMSGYGNAGLLIEMRDCFHSMCQAGIKPRLSTLNILVNVHCSLGLLNEAENLLNDAYQMSLRPTAESYSILVRAYANKKCFDKVESLMKNMELAGIELGRKSFLEMLGTYESGIQELGPQMTSLAMEPAPYIDGREAKTFITHG